MEVRGQLWVGFLLSLQDLETELRVAKETPYLQSHPFAQSSQKVCVIYVNHKKAETKPASLYKKVASCTSTQNCLEAEGTDRTPTFAFSSSQIALGALPHHPPGPGPALHHRSHCVHPAKLQYHMQRCTQEKHGSQEVNAVLL